MSPGPDYITVTITGNGEKFYVHAKGDQVEDLTDRYELEFIEDGHGRSGFILMTKEPAQSTPNLEPCL